MGTAPILAETAAPTLTTVPSSMTLEQPAPLTFAPVASVRPTARPRVEPLPDLRWDHVRGSTRWTRAAMQALESHGQRLIDTEPRDIGEWCPAYVGGSDWERKAFWAGLLSTLAKHESTYRPNAVGGGGLWYGLVQILPATARGYGCQARTGDALKDGALNMSCAVRILNVTVPRDGVVSQGMRGVAADWGPFHSGRKREDMRRWVRSQPFCNGLHTSMRPVARPEGMGGETYAEDDVSAAPEGEIVPLFVSWELDKDFLARKPAWPATVARVDDDMAFADIDG
ncbi:transglycosylase SLT domain-containing protein [Jannaschia pohangensis]|nr:transglycosylase SLT domain-containing protein [Jannaschia pohangensis]